jgi:hypothetical protein
MEKTYEEHRAAFESRYTEEMNAHLSSSRSTCYVRSLREGPGYGAHRDYLNSQWIKYQIENDVPEYVGPAVPAPPPTYVGYQMPVEWADLASPVFTGTVVPDMEHLRKQFIDAYAAFVGAFDTPQMRRRMPDEYSEDARKRMREFAELLGI